MSETAILRRAAPRLAKNGPTAVRQRSVGAGFTLLELLLVVAIIAMASAGVSLALRDSAQSQLEMEAQRLAAVLDGARAQARATGVAVRWQTTDSGYALDGRATSWQYPGVVAEAPPQGLLLGPEPLMARASVRLWRADKPANAVVVATDGLRPFGITPAP